MSIRKNTIFTIVILVCSLATLLSVLFVPFVEILVADPEVHVAIVNYQPFSLLDYIETCVFWLFGADLIYYLSDGPSWIPVATILLNLLTVAMAFVMICICVFELITCKNHKLNVKKNNLFAKFAKVFGFYSISCYLLNFVAYIITTKMANGYLGFYADYGLMINFILAIAIIVCAFLMTKNNGEQTKTKVRNCLGYALSAIFSILLVVFIFVPQFTEYFLGDKPLSFWQFGLKASDLVHDVVVGADYVIGISTWLSFAIIGVCFVITLCSVIGIIKTLKNKQTFNLAKNVRVWTLVLLIVYALFYFCVLGGVAGLMSNIMPPAPDNETISFVLPLFYFAFLFVPLPYISSQIVLQKKK